jgi:hypothetical protein
MHSSQERRNAVMCLPTLPRGEMFFFVFTYKNFTNVMSLATKILRLIPRLIITLSDTIILLSIGAGLDCIY